jgi:hypothetical protein
LIYREFQGHVNAHRIRLKVLEFIHHRHRHKIQVNRQRNQNQLQQLHQELWFRDGIKMRFINETILFLSRRSRRKYRDGRLRPLDADETPTENGKSIESFLLIYSSTF